MTWPWNEIESAPASAPSLQDETLRDGIQSPSAIDPPIADKIALLHAIDAVAIDLVNVGMPATSARHHDDFDALCREIVASRLRVRPVAAGRTFIADLEPIVETSQKLGIAIGVCTFIGSSPIRRLAEDWSLEWVLRVAGEAIDFATREGLEVTYVTEDATRTPPEVLRALFDNALDKGARRICLADTVGHATPAGVSALCAFTRSVVDAHGATGIGIDFHGHNDRGLVLANSLAAVRAGADRIHGCALGIGERVGNAPLELLLANLDRMGGTPPPHGLLVDYCRVASRVLRWPIPVLHPMYEETRVVEDAAAK